MKKILFALITIIALTGCSLTGTETGDYKEGVYFGFDADSNYTAAVTIDKDGNIAGVLIDAAYIEPGSCVIEEEEPTCNASTKRILGDAYGMARTDGQLEWFEQADAFAAAVVENQGLDFVEWKYRTKDEAGNYVFTNEMPTDQTEEDKVYTDAVSKVTIHVIEPYNAVKSALDQAKK